MAALDFPNGPSIGDRYPTPAVAGLPQYKWDGEKWTTAAIDTTVAPPASAVPLEDNATPQVGVTTKYAREDHVHPSTALKYSAQTLTIAQQEQSRKNLYAAPFDAMAYSGMQINGSMEISQERGVTATNVSGAHSCDGWLYYYSGTMTVNTATIAAPTLVPGFTNVVYMSTAVAQASINAGDYAVILHKMEGYRISRLAWGTAGARPVTLAFWSVHSKPGLYSGTVRNGPTSNRSYAFTYTHAAANIAQYNVVTIPGDTAGTWTADNTAGIIVTFAMACGATSTAPSANTWLAGNYFAAPGQINAVSALTDIFRITGVVVLPGIEAPSAERSSLIMRPYDQELLTCQRYWRLVMPDIRFWAANTGTIVTYTFSVPEMRVGPTTVKVANGTSNLVNEGASGLFQITPSTLRMTLTASAGGDAYIYSRTYSCDARL